MTNKDTPRQFGRPARKKKQRRTLSEDLAQSDLLEVEKIRLEKLQSLFNEKLPRWGRFPRHRDLYERQWKHRNELRTKLVQAMADEKSLFQKYLQNFFNQIF